MGGESHDVVIVGGGLAGLCLAVQLRQRLAEVDVVVVDPRTERAPEIVHTVGESAVEVGSWYFREVLGLGDHLKEAQLPKFGLRYFMTAGDNRDISRRLEFGVLDFGEDTEAVTFNGLPLPTYNLDRGRLENCLADRCDELGIRRLLGAKVKDVDIDARQHTVHVDTSTGHEKLRARWVVDASGRSGRFKAKLGLAEDTDHRWDATWFRVPGPIDPDDFSDDAEWLGRTAPGLRRLSTNHLVGKGYWVWLIPLSSGATSVGIVGDPALHPIDGRNRPERALSWFRDHEPQLASVLETRETLDFHVMRGGAYGCKRVFSPSRWAIVGDAGVFLDPLYSPGSDFIAVANTLVTDLIEKDRNGEPLAGAVHFASTLFRSLFENYLDIYRGQYPALAHPQAMVTKAVWDTAVYFGFTVPLFQNGRLFSAVFMDGISRETAGLRILQARMQQLFRRWGSEDYDPASRRGTSVDQLALGFLQGMYFQSKPPHSDRELHDLVVGNIATMGAFAALVEARATDPELALRPATSPLEADVNRLWGGP